MRFFTHSQLIPVFIIQGTSFIQSTLFSVGVLFFCALPPLVKFFSWIIFLVAATLLLLYLGRNHPWLSLAMKLLLLSALVLFVMPGSAVPTSEPAKAASESETPDEVRRWLRAPRKTPSGGRKIKKKQGNKKGGSDARNSNSNCAAASFIGGD